MSVAATPLSAGSDLVSVARTALEGAEKFVQSVGAQVGKLCQRHGQVNPALLDRHQVEAHGYAWMASYLEILRATLEWAEALDAASELGRLPALLLEIGFGEY